MRILLIDDMRTNEMLPWLEPATDVARRFDSAIEKLREGNWDFVYLDHDLGEDDMNKTGAGIMNFLEANTQFLPGKIILVTSNPVGRRRMEVVIERLYGSKE